MAFGPEHFAFEYVAVNVLSAILHDLEILLAFECCMIKINKSDTWVSFLAFHCALESG
jgi:hypothetical protein